MVIAIAAMVLGAVMGDPGASDHRSSNATAARAWAVAAPPRAAAPDGGAGREIGARGRVVTAGASGSPVTAVMLAVATTLFFAWSLIRTVARWIA